MAEVASEQAVQELALVMDDRCVQIPVTVIVSSRAGNLGNDFVGQ